MTHKVHLVWTGIHLHIMIEPACNDAANRWITLSKPGHMSHMFWKLASG